MRKVFAMFAVVLAILSAIALLTEKTYFEEVALANPDN